MRKVVRKLCALTFFWDLVFIYAVDKLFFLDRGLTIVEIALMMSLWAAMTLVFEVPSGILADRWNRKYLLVVSGLARALFCIVWLFSDSFSGFLVGFLFLAISQSFLSGTTQAYLHDALTKEKEEDQFERYWGKVEASRLIGLSIAWMVGGLVSTTSFNPALLLSVGSGFICFLVALSLPSISRMTRSEEETPFKHLFETLRYALRHQVIFQVFIFALIVRSSYVIIDEYWAVYFNYLHISPAIFGLLVGLSTLSGSLAGFLAHEFKNQPWKAVRVGTIILSSVLFIAFVSKSWIAALLMLLLEFATGVLYILTEGQLQKHAEPNRRATVSSVAALLKETGVITGVIFGIITSKFDLQAGYLFFALFILLYFPASWIARKTMSR